MTNVIFPDANQIRNEGGNLSIVHNEVRSIESAVLVSSDSGLLDAIVYNTFMTDTNLADYVQLDSVSYVDNTLTKEDHGLVSGDEVDFVTDNALPIPIQASVTYYVIVVDADTFQIASSYMDVVNNNPIDIIDSGSGQTSFRKMIPSQKYYKVFNGTRTDRALLQQMNSVIKHFTDLGYSIKRKTNPNVTGIFMWQLSW